MQIDLIHNSVVPINGFDFPYQDLVDRVKEVCPAFDFPYLALLPASYVSGWARLVKDEKGTGVVDVIERVDILETDIYRAFNFPLSTLIERFYRNGYQGDWAEAEIHIGNTFEIAQIKGVVEFSGEEMFPGVIAELKGKGHQVTSCRL